MSDIEDLKKIVASLQKEVASLKSKAVVSPLTIDPLDLMNPSDLFHYQSNPANDRLIVALEGQDKNYNANLINLFKHFTNDRIGSLLYSIDHRLELPNLTNGLILLNDFRTIDIDKAPLLYDKLVALNSDYLHSSTATQFTLKPMTGKYAMSKGGTGVALAEVGEALPDPTIKTDIKHDHTLSISSDDILPSVFYLEILTDESEDRYAGVIARKTSNDDVLSVSSQSSKRIATNSITSEDDTVNNKLTFDWQNLLSDLKITMVPMEDPTNRTGNPTSSVYSNGAKITPMTNEVFCYMCCDFKL